MQALHTEMMSRLRTRFQAKTSFSRTELQQIINEVELEVLRERIDEPEPTHYPIPPTEAEPWK